MSTKATDAFVLQNLPLLSLPFFDRPSNVREINRFLTRDFAKRQLAVHWSGNLNLKFKDLNIPDLNFSKLEEKWGR